MPQNRLANTLLTALLCAGLAAPSLASDAPYGDLDDDGVPDVAVGRLPVDTPQELIEWTERNTMLTVSSSETPS